VLEGGQNWFRGCRIARNEGRGLLHLRTRRSSHQPKTARQANLARFGAGLTSAGAVRARSGLFAHFLRKLGRLNEAGLCAFRWIWWGRRYL
jgi:hypothetical protein